MSSPSLDPRLVLARAGDAAALSSVLAELNKHGYAGRRATLEKVAQLHKRYRFVFVDAQDIRNWGGTATDWSNATHINRVNMRRLLRYVVAHSDGALH